MRIAGTVNDSIVDGPGLRYTVFFQGCGHHCKGCHNPQTWKPYGGKEVTLADIATEICANPLLSGITLSGGDPLYESNVYDALSLAHLIKTAKPKMDVWCYTGYTFDEIVSNKDSLRYRLLKYVDVLVDGPYVEAKRDLTLLFRGSSNQRLIDVQASLKTGKIILRQDEDELQIA